MLANMRSWAGEGKGKYEPFRPIAASAKLPQRFLLALDVTEDEYGKMPGIYTRYARNRRTGRERADPWKRVGAFVCGRREELGLSQSDIIRVLGYKSRNPVSNVEIGIEGLPAKRAYAWADVLEVPRDAFFHFVTGRTVRLDIPNAKPRGGDRLTAADAELLRSYRRLREQAAEFETLSRAASRQKNRRGWPDQ